MENKEVRPWYKKKRYLIPIGTVVALGFIRSGENTSSLNSQESQVYVPTVQERKIEPINAVAQPQSATIKVETKTDISADLSNDNHYTNSVGNEVHSPAYSNTVPAGASARCRDGTYSFSQSRRGTCSHHGGVAEWL